MSRLLYQAELHRREATHATAGRRVERSPLTESNRRPSPYHGDALPTELRGRRGPSRDLHDLRRPGVADGRRPTRRPVVGLVGVSPLGRRRSAGCARRPGACSSRSPAPASCWASWGHARDVVVASAARASVQLAAVAGAARRRGRARCRSACCSSLACTSSRAGPPARRLVRSRCGWWCALPVGAGPLPVVAPAAGARRRPARGRGRWSRWPASSSAGR